MKMTRMVRRAALLSAISVGLIAGAAHAAGGVAPETKAPPTISGTAAGGKTLTAGNGVWANSPTKYGYQWLRCDDKGATCASITGATDQTYTVASADVGRTLMLLVTATNADGSSTA